MLRLLSEVRLQVVQMCEVKDGWMLPARVGMMVALKIFKQITGLATCKGKSIDMRNSFLHSI